MKCPMTQPRIPPDEITRTGIERMFCNGALTPAGRTSSSQVRFRFHLWDAYRLDTPGSLVSMPYDPRIDDLLSRIQQGGSLTRSQARRVLIEKIDVAKRENLSDPDRSYLEIVTADGEVGVKFKKPQAQVSIANPFREHVLADHEANARVRATKTREINHKQRAALEAGNRIRHEQAESASGRPNGRKRTVRAPTPGTITAMIVGALKDPDFDFNDAFISLRSRKQLAHVDDTALKQRMREVSWRYDLRIWHRPTRLQDSTVNEEKEVKSMVTAKFRVSRLTPWGNGEIVDGVITAPEGENPGGEVELTPDYAQGRNADWASATPSGVIRLTITNPSALARFKQGQAYTITFQENDE